MFLIPNNIGFWVFNLGEAEMQSFFTWARSTEFSRVQTANTKRNFKKMYSLENKTKIFVV